MKADSKKADGDREELVRLRHRLLKQIVDNQKRRDSQLREAAAATPAPPSLRLDPPATPSPRETG